MATSVGITGRVLSDLGQLRGNEARIIIGAAVIDDVLGLLVLAAVAAAARHGDINPTELAVTAAQAVGFTAAVALTGGMLVRRLGVYFQRLRIRNGAFAVAMAACLSLAALSAQIGLASIIGAFLAGMVWAETDDQLQLERQAEPLYELLVPFFFVVTGGAMDWRLLLDGATAGIAVSVIVVAIVGKVVGSALGALGLEWRQVAIIGVGMVPRGEVSLVVAATGVGWALSRSTC